MVRTLNARLDVRDLDGSVDTGLRRWIHERLDRQLGKFAPQVERVDVRFGDENGHKGGVDRSCLVHVVLSALPSVVVEVRGETPREAFDMAAGRAERATQRSIEKHGLSTKHKVSRRRRNAKMPATPDVVLDGEEATASADHTATRNLKLNRTGMPYRLEDSTTGKPSRKSTRAGANHIKPANALTLRSRRATHSPKAIATRG
jgi:putative sigma-54 modulation protein